MSSVKIKNGWNQTPESLEDLSGTLFADYAPADGVYMRWWDSEETEFNGNREEIEIGLPKAQWVFDVWTREEMAYWKSNFGTRVSITTLNKSENEYQTFNAKMGIIKVGDTDFDQGWFTRVEVNFYDLEEIE